MRSALLTIALAVSLLIAGCNPETADTKQRRATEMALKEASTQVGMPDITRFQELKMARDMIELRDKALPTYTYIVSMHGDLIFLGESIGFGLPYSVQFSNPQKLVRPYSTATGRISMPQAEPNGLFMPDGLSATWILLKGNDGKVHPVYMEPEIIVSPFKLHATKMATRVVDTQ